HGERPQPLPDAAAARLSRLVLAEAQPGDILITEQAAASQCLRAEQVLDCPGQPAEHPVSHRHAHAELSAPDELARQVLLPGRLEDVLLTGTVQLELRRQTKRC